MTKVGIVGTGHCLPEKILTNDELSTMVDTSDEWITSRTGIHARHIATHETSLDLALAAAQQALLQAGIAPQELGLIICATLTPDRLSPSLACSLLQALGAKCPAFDVNAACSGFLFALGSTQKMMGNRPALVVGCERISHLVDWTDRTTCVLFGDGAGAVVLSPEGGHPLLDVELMSYPDEKGAIVIPGINQSCEGQPVHSAIHMQGQEVYRFATRTMVSDIRKVLSRHRLSAEDIEWFVPHQANVRIIQTASDLLKIPMERFYMNIERTGNTSCAGVAIALDELARSGKIKPGDHVLLSAFGGGLTSATALIQWV